MPSLAVELGKLTASIGVDAVYGEQQDLDGVRVIPVALSCRGFGAGEMDGEGGGGGGGGFAAPLGAYVREGDRVRFEPNIIALLVVATPLVIALGKTLSRVIRALKKR